mgnify:CR=1 FL=1
MRLHEIIIERTGDDYFRTETVVVRDDGSIEREKQDEYFIGINDKIHLTFHSDKKHLRSKK